MDGEDRRPSLAFSSNADPGRGDSRPHTEEEAEVNVHLSYRLEKTAVAERACIDGLKREPLGKVAYFRSRIGVIAGNEGLQLFRCAGLGGGQAGEDRVERLDDVRSGSNLLGFFGRGGRMPSRSSL